MKAFADDKIDVAVLSDRIENIVGKGEKASNQHFLLFPQFFQKPSFLGSFKVGIVWEQVKSPFHRSWLKT